MVGGNNNYLSDKEVNSSNKELNDILIKEYEKAEQEKIKAEKKAIEQMNSEGIYTPEQLNDLNNMGIKLEGPEALLDMIIPTEKDTIDVETDNLFGD